MTVPWVPMSSTASVNDEAVARPTKRAPPPRSAAGHNHWLHAGPTSTADGMAASTPTPTAQAMRRPLVVHSRASEEPGGSLKFTSAR